MEELQVDKEIVNKAEISTMSDCEDLMLKGLREGKEKGSTTHIKEIDNCWRWRKQEFNIWTGYMNEGKSQFIRYLSLIKAIKDGWKFLFCAPEDYPAAEFFDDIIHTVAGQSTDRDNPNCISEQDYKKAIELVRHSIIFVYIKPPNNTIKGVLETFKPLIDLYSIDACIIDPLIKFARPKNFSERDDIYAAYITSICTDFSREYNLSLHLVMHQLTPRIQETTQTYPKPTVYNIKGGGTWADGCDNILSIWRPNYATNKIDSAVVFASQKIKKQKLVGIPQEFRMEFDRRTNRYVNENTQKDLWEFPSIKTFKLQ